MGKERSYNETKDELLDILQGKMDELMNRLRNEDIDGTLDHLVDNGELMFTTLTIHDQSAKDDYNITQSTYTASHGYRDNVIYAGEDEDVAEQVFDNLLDAMGSQAMWFDKNGHCQY